MPSVHIGCDHAGLDLKRFLLEKLAALNWRAINHGTDSAESCDYPLIAKKLCDAVIRTGEPGILICGTGIGMSIAANRFPGIRAALCSCELQARMARRHNNANILCLGARVSGSELCAAIVASFLENEFEGGRHQRRLDEIDG
ncbi:MAG: ribose 5-phosphate isomerase B [Desulfovibrio sp.]|nr:ribose 5-phosphate isomerase B [Desulfovibrio sp.]